MGKEQGVHSLIMSPVKGSCCLHDLDSHVPDGHAPESQMAHLLSDVGVHGDASYVLDRHSLQETQMRS